MAKISGKVLISTLVITIFLIIPLIVFTQRSVVAKFNYYYL